MSTPEVTAPEEANDEEVDEVDPEEPEEGEQEEDDDDYDEEEEDSPHEEPPQEQYRDEYDADEILRKEKRAKCECITVVSVAIAIIVIVVATVTVLAINNRPTPVEETDPPTMAPTIGITEPQLQLDFLRENLGKNNFTLEYLDLIPGDIASLEGKYSDPAELPAVRAASWLVDADGNNRESNLMRRFALASIFYANGGGNWTNSSNWLSVKNHCEWYGVTCCGGFLDKVAPSCAGPDPGEVVYVSLSNNNVTGNITNAFSLLTSLQALDLGFNSITGELPGVMLGQLPNLMSISVQHNEMSGTIPKELGKNGVLHTLFVQRNNFEGKWPQRFCYPKLDKFGLDCDKVNCQSQACCNPDVFCYYDADT